MEHSMARPEKIFVRGDVVPSHKPTVASNGRNKHSVQFYAHGFKAGLNAGMKSGKSSVQILIPSHAERRLCWRANGLANPVNKSDPRIQQK
eukprot:c48563_g1_i1 orf=94-366(+)